MKTKNLTLFKKNKYLQKINFVLFKEIYNNKGDKMALFEKFLGIADNIAGNALNFIADHNKEINAVGQLAVHGLPWVLGAVCTFGGVYGLPAYLGITYPKDIVAKFQKEKYLSEPQKLWWQLTNWEEIDDKKYKDIYAKNKNLTPTEMNSLYQQLKLVVK